MIGSVDRALRLLKEIRDNGALSVGQAARTLDVAPSTAQRLMATMKGHGFLRQNADRSYALGPEMVRTQVLQPQVSAMRDVVAPLLADLALSTGETAHLLVLENTLSRYVACAESPHPYRVHSLVGSTMPSHCSAGGTAQLAHLPRSVVDTIYAEGVPPWPDAVIHTVPELQSVLDETRERGYARSMGETRAGVIGLGAVILGDDGYPMGAITLAIPEPRFAMLSETELVARLQETVDAAQTRLHRAT